MDLSTRSSQPARLAGSGRDRTSYRYSILVVIQKFSVFLALLLAIVAPPHSGKEIKLVVVLCVDQMLPEYFNFSRFPYTAGLKRLYTEGFFYANADLNYATTLTSPAHATLSTGSYPKVSGISDNNWMDRRTGNTIPSVDDPASNPVGGEQAHISPKNLMVDGLGDWLKAKLPESKVVSVAGKNRSAVFMGGRRPHSAYWFNPVTHQMVTSSYYTRILPEWVKGFNSSGWSERNIPSDWTAQNGSGFSHPLQSSQKNAQLASPFHDLLILTFAIRAIRYESLGQSRFPDVLFVGLSATDHIGHTFGTESPEMRDHLLRLDVALGNFLDMVEKLVGKNKFVIALTSDHGALREPVRRINFDQSIRPLILELDRSLQLEWKLEKSLIQQLGTRGGFLEYSAALSKGVNEATVEQRFRKGLRGIDGISDAYFRRELTGPSLPNRPNFQQYQNSYYPPRDMDFQLRFCEDCLVFTGSLPWPTSHGSPYTYDTHIPLLFWGGPVPPGRADYPVYMVDVAPTLARILNLSYPATVNGKPLPEVTGK